MLMSLIVSTIVDTLSQEKFIIRSCVSRQDSVIEADCLKKLQIETV